MDIHSTKFIKVSQEHHADYIDFFKSQNHIKNFVDFAIGYLHPEIWVDHLKKPTVGFMFAGPAVVFQGDADATDIPLMLDQIPADMWLVPTSERWEERIVSHFGPRLQAQHRTSFDHTSLRLEHLESLKKSLPAGLKLMPIDQKHAADSQGLLYTHDLQVFFASADFMEKGVGFCILDEDEIIAYASSNFPMDTKHLEVSIRVANHEKYRGKGLAQAVSIALLEYCLQHGIEPNWDAANETSAHIALKLGYTLRAKWRMYHLLDYPL